MKFENIGNEVEIIDCIDKCFFTGEQVSFGVIRESEDDGRVFCPNNSVVLNVKQVGEVLTNLENNSEEKMMIKESELKSYGIELAVGDTLRNMNAKNTEAFIIADLDDDGDYELVSGGYWRSNDSVKNGSVVVEFAPRKNDGNQPDVVVDVLYPSENGTTWSKRDLSSDVDWEFAVSWKPSMEWLTEQSNIKTEDEIQAMAKPVFTQADSDAGMLPPVGSDFIHKASDQVVTSISISDFYEGVVTFKDSHGSIDCCWATPNFIEPILTARSKSIAACMAVGGLRARDGAELVYGRLYDAGLLKLDTNP